LTGSKRLWETFYFATLHNPDDEILEGFGINRTELPYFVQIYGGGHYSRAKEQELGSEETLADDGLDSKDQKTYELGFYKF
jgi:hypothetical protein